jgi:hypothetical protein
MSKTIVISLPHNLTAAEAQRRIAAQIDSLRNAYVDKLAHSEVTWTGDSADIRVIALMQQITAHIDVLPDSVRVDITLPWILAGVAGKVETLLTSSAGTALALPPPSKMKT